jgi:hypothetical protein
MSLDAADVFLAEKKRQDPARYAEVCKKYPVQSQDNQARDKNDGISPRMARYLNGPSGGVPKAHKRTFTDEEWREVQQASRIGRRELAIDYAHALQLVRTSED